MRHIWSGASLAPAAQIKIGAGRWEAGAEPRGRGSAGAAAERQAAPTGQRRGVTRTSPRAPQPAFLRGPFFFLSPSLRQNHTAFEPVTMQSFALETIKIRQNRRKNIFKAPRAQCRCVGAARSLPAPVPPSPSPHQPRRDTPAPPAALPAPLLHSPPAATAPSLSGGEDGVFLAQALDQPIQLHPNYLCGNRMLCQKCYSVYLSILPNRRRA